MIKYFALAFCVFGIYASLELTRLIVFWSKSYGQRLLMPDLALELLFIWLSYGLMAGLLLYLAWRG